MCVAPLILGSSPALTAALNAAQLLAPTSCTVLLTGPTGTGKELFARLLHALSARPGPFIAVNCAGLSSSLAETELFGHTRGAFTGATSSRLGLFREAEHGTLFLDEIGELPLDVQAILLRVLQEKAVRPLGSCREETVDVRIVAATHRVLSERVEQGTFREDLLYRLLEGEVHLPPLSERRQDIPVIARALLNDGLPEGTPRRTLGRAAARLLMAASWPGNVRELKHFIQRLRRETPEQAISAPLVARLLGKRLEQMPEDDPTRVLATLDICGACSSTELRQKLGLSRNRVLQVLELLQGQGAIRREGQARQTRYVRVTQ